MDLEIKYRNGQMILHLDVFFPTLQAKLKKLLKVINLDRNKDAHIQTLNQYFDDRLQDLEIRMKKSGRSYFNHKQKFSDTARMVDSNKKPSGVMLKKEELEELKNKLKVYKKMTADQLKEYKRCEREIRKFQKHIETLKQRK